MAVDSNKIAGFFETQLAAWPMAAANFEALGGVKVKELDVNGMPFKVQFNPARMASSGAKVDAASLKARPCFLCEKNRPEVQIGIEWNDRYTILVNPFPIFHRHLTIPDTSHTDQLIAGRIADMMGLAAELNGYTVFYNGPRCGASAPDHMHFQAGNSDFLTIAPAIENAELKTIAADGDATLSLVDTLPVKVFVIDAADHSAGERLFGRLLEAMPVPEGEREPMLNLLCYSTPAGERLVVIPRKRHRPACYGTDNGCMLISPASVDVGGVFITPRPEDFERMDQAAIASILDEVCLTAEEIGEIASHVR
jgi:ATP adenylyltransferase/5',5'''-P-1,P-4-tetraphosphate phosphorylase II